MISASPEFIEAMISRKPKEVYLKMELFDKNMSPLYETTTFVSKDDIASINCSRNRPIRRSFSFALDNRDGRFSWGSNKLIWINKRIKLSIGLKVADGTVHYAPQGVYVLTDLYDTHILEGGKKCYITGQDKAYLLTGRYGKLRNHLTIEQGGNIGDIIKIIATQAGETMFNFDEVDDTIPYTFYYEPGDNYWDIISELALKAQCSIYYDYDGFLRLKKIDLNDFTNYPETWIYEFQGENGHLYAGNERHLNPENMANHIIVLGGSGSTAICSAELIVTNTDPLWEDSPYTVEEIGSLLFLYNNGNPSGILTTDDECLWRAKWELMNRLGFSERVPIYVWPNYLHEPEDIIKIVHNESGINARYMIDNFNLPIVPEIMTLECRRQEIVISDWNFI